MNRKLPAWAVGLVERLAPSSRRDAVVGDFIEAFARMTRGGRHTGRAWLWYWIQLARSVPSFITIDFYLEGGMFKNYLIVSGRNLSKRKFFSALNIGGLAIGMAACLLIFQYVVFEQSFDDYHENADRLYRLNFGHSKNGETSVAETSVSALGPLMLEEVPEIEDFARVHPCYSEITLSYVGAGGTPEVVRVDGGAYVDPQFIRMFSYPFVRGDRRTALDLPNSLVLSRSAAKRHFGDENPIGKQVEVRSWAAGTYTVTGVFEDAPPNSHLRLDYLMPLNDLLTRDTGQYADTDGWQWTNFITYALLHPDADPEAVSAKTSALVNERRHDEVESTGSEFVVRLQAVPDIHLYSDFESDFNGWSKGNRRTVYFFTIVALFVLAIAWVNYINLTTARAIERAKEVGVRKAVGARKGQVVTQFIFESVLVNVIALVLAIGLAIVALPYLNRLVDTAVDMSVWDNPRLLASFLVVFGLGAVIASLYPAFVLSAYRPSTVLKGGSRGRSHRDRLRKILVVFQFAASVSLLIGTYVVYSQVQFIRNHDPGLELSHVLVVERPTVFSDAQDRDARVALSNRFMEEVSHFAAVKSVATSSSVPGGDFSLGTTYARSGAPQTEAETVNVTWINYDFGKTYGLKWVAGRNFSRELETDREEAVIANETAVRKLGFELPKDGVGQRVRIGSNDERSFQIVGVVKDFNWMSAKQEIPPVLFVLTPSGGSFYSLDVQTSDLESTIASVQSKFEALFPGNPFDYFFADRFFDEQYKADQRFSELFGLFALFALIVACLGLVGLAAYTAGQRTKEIGIRKAHGARSFDIIRMMLAETGKLLVAAAVLSAPLMWFALNRWLSEFPVRIDLSIWLFFIPAATVLLVAFLTVTYPAARAAVANPVESLRYE